MFVFFALDRSHTASGSHVTNAVLESTVIPRGKLKRPFPLKVSNFIFTVSFG